MSSFGRELLLHIDRQGDESLGGQLKRQLREAIRAGSLRGGLRLPSTRALADQLGLSRPVVVNVYEQPRATYRRDRVRLRRLRRLGSLHGAELAYSERARWRSVTTYGPPFRTWLCFHARVG